MIVSICSHNFESEGVQSRLSIMTDKSL